MLEPPLLVLEAAAEQMVCVRAHGLNPGRVVLLLRRNATKKGVGALTRGPIQSVSQRRREGREEITGSGAERLAGWPKKKTGAGSPMSL